MKNVYAIVAASAGFSLVEVVLLFTVAVPDDGGPDPGVRNLFILLAQLLLIPAFGALFLRLIYGGKDWRRRVLRTVLVVFGIVSTAVLTGFLLHWLDEMSSTIADIVAPTVFAAEIGIILVWCWKQGRKRAVELEAERWIAQRHSKLGFQHFQRRENAIRLAVCVPSFVVLLAFLFLPQVWGIVSHLVHFRSRTVNGYHVPIPVTWVVVSTGKQFATGITAEALEASPKRYLYFGDIPLSGWHVYTHLDRRPRRDKVLAERNFLLNGTVLTCRETWPYRTIDPASVMVDCSTSDHFEFGLLGERQELPQFYDVASRITIVH